MATTPTSPTCTSKTSQVLLATNQVAIADVQFTQMTTTMGQKQQTFIGHSITGSERESPKIIITIKFIESDYIKDLASPKLTTTDYIFQYAIIKSSLMVHHKHFLQQVNS